jgi:tetratricopeptide (TPR) repeat protein
MFSIVFHYVVNPSWQLAVGSTRRRMSASRKKNTVLKPSCSSHILGRARTNWHYISPILGRDEGYHMREDEPIERLTEADMPGIAFVKKIRSLLEEEITTPERKDDAQSQSIPSEVIDYYNQAQGYEANNQFGKVLETLLEAINLVPDCARCWSAFGPSLLRMGWRKEAEGVTKRALELDGNSPKIWADYGDLLIYQKKIDEAANAYERSIELDSENDYVWHNLGSVYLAQQKIDGTIKAWQEVTRINPKAANVWFNLGTLLDSLGQRAEAEAAYAKFIQLRPQDGPKAVAIAKERIAAARRGQGQGQPANFGI